MSTIYQTSAIELMKRYSKVVYGQEQALFK